MGTDNAVIEDLETEDKSRRWLVVAAGCFAVALIIYIGAGRLFAAESARTEPLTDTLPLVELTTIEPVDQVFTVEEEGFLRPRAEVSVVPEIAGKVVEVSDQLEPGGRFAAGEILYRIDPTTFEADLLRAEADVASAEASLRRAQAENGRQKRLSDIGAASASDLDTARSNLASARAQVKQAEAALVSARKSLADTEVRAPFDASVIDDDIALGDYVQPGQSTATIFDVSAGEIILDLLPVDARAVRAAADDMNAPLPVTIEPTGASASTIQLTGYIKRFGNSVDLVTRTVPVVVEVPGAFSGEGGQVAYANDFMHVTMPARSNETLYATASGVIRQAQFLWLLDGDSRLTAVPATPVDRDGSMVIFRSPNDLDGREAVLTALTEETEGAEVKVVTASSAAGSETLQ
ncbi:MAG: efflux RND transporter periplasmic adaptor subunit [Pseudomonadota bacterium]